MHRKNLFAVVLTCTLTLFLAYVPTFSLASAYLLTCGLAFYLTYLLEILLALYLAFWSIQSRILFGIYSGILSQGTPELTSHSPQHQKGRRKKRMGRSCSGTFSKSRGPHLAGGELGNASCLLDLYAGDPLASLCRDSFPMGFPSCPPLVCWQLHRVF